MHAATDMHATLARCRAVVEESASVIRGCASDELLADLTRAASMLVGAYRAGGKALFFGNGGSASQADHFAAEFVGRFRRERRSLPALALGTHNSALTAIANDYGFESLFARQLEGLARPGDVAVAISTSGRSPNVVRAVEHARQSGLATIAMTGPDGGELAARVDVCMRVAASSTARIQEGHLLLGHLLCELVEEELFASEGRRDATQL